MTFAALQLTHAEPSRCMNTCIRQATAVYSRSLLTSAKVVHT